MARRPTAPADPSPPRVVLERLDPEIDAGRFPVKRVVGERVRVEVDLFAEGHDLVAGRVLHRRRGAEAWEEEPLEALGNDRWRGAFRVGDVGREEYTVEGWVDAFGTWRRDVAKKLGGGQDVAIELEVGARLVDAAAKAAPAADADHLLALAASLRDPSRPQPDRVELAASDELGRLMERHGLRPSLVRWPRVLEVVVDPVRARFSAWYELFPRSFAERPGEHGTLRDAERQLPRIEGMGFDVLYLPPIHPIGRAHRKGPNNAPRAGPDDPGSPWAIGAEEGGHDAVHPELGTVEDVRRLAEAARERGIELALDLAFQCAPDHPWVREHPEWFRHRPDGSIQYAENPPKKYQDIYPLDFEGPEWRALWEALRDVTLFWVEQGVRIFRVDNPHTKPFAFWEWMIAEVKERHPDVLFLSEAFTRPKVMYRLAKLGFTQSYTYFAWKNRRWELVSYLRELVETEVREYFRPSFWPNTPDILNEYLQAGGPPAFQIRLLLAATLSSCYGIYGPVFELCEGTPREPGSEEYLDSEKYQVRSWDVERPGNLGALIARVNRIRREHPALQRTTNLRFLPVDNEMLVAYVKLAEDGEDPLLCVVNLDPRWRQSGWIELDPALVGMEADGTFQVHDLLDDSRFLWSGGRNFVELDPHEKPAHVFRVRRRVRTEKDFEYFL